MAFYTELLSENLTGSLSFDDTVLGYSGATVIVSEELLVDGGVPITIALPNGMSLTAAWYQSGDDPVVVITADQLVQLPDAEQALIKEYEQCPVENPENPGRRLGVVRPRKVAP